MSMIGPALWVKAAVSGTCTIIPRATRVLVHLRNIVWRQTYSNLIGFPYSHWHFSQSWSLFCYKRPPKRALLCSFNVLNILIWYRARKRSWKVVGFLFLFGDRHASCSRFKFWCWREASKWIDVKRKPWPVEFPRQDERALLGWRERRAEDRLEKERFYYQWSRSYRRNSHWLWYFPLTDQYPPGNEFDRFFSSRVARLWTVGIVRQSLLCRIGDDDHQIWRWIFVPYGSIWSYSCLFVRLDLCVNHTAGIGRHNRPYLRWVRCEAVLPRLPTPNISHEAPRLFLSR